VGEDDLGGMVVYCKGQQQCPDARIRSVHTCT
jgi:hypothetical protein